MNKFLASAALLLTFGEAQAHNHPGIDNLTHSLEHLAANYPTGMPYVSGLALAAALAFLVWHSRRAQ
ncbi:MAG: hypothetical protein PHH11_16685 [Methylomonas sp.]|nr:hypothetical protein [Methylomonas sp.]